VSALGEEDYTHLDFGGIVAFFSATMLTKSQRQLITERGLNFENCLSPDGA
tara:strand:- start:922 stop:1074 length:153 start_codon:yes stop_codon:yes gene_type:complete